MKMKSWSFIDFLHFLTPYSKYIFGMMYNDLILLYLNCIWRCQISFFLFRLRKQFEDKTENDSQVHYYAPCRSNFPLSELGQCLIIIVLKSSKQTLKDNSTHYLMKYMNSPRKYENSHIDSLLYYFCAVTLSETA